MTGDILTAAAESDLRGIVRYTRKQWGDAQVRRYSPAKIVGKKGAAASRSAEVKPAESPVYIENG